MFLSIFGQQRNIMGKDTKGKGNTCAKKVKGRKSVAEKQDIHEAMHNFLKHPHW